MTLACIVLFDMRQIFCGSGKDLHWTWDLNPSRVSDVLSRAGRRVESGYTNVYVFALLFLFAFIGSFVCGSLSDSESALACGICFALSMYVYNLLP